MAKIAAFLRPQRFPLLVSGGRVACPRNIFDVDVDRCFGCDLFEGLLSADNGAWVQCRATRTRPAPVEW